MILNSGRQGSKEQHRVCVSLEVLSNHFSHAVSWAIESEPGGQGCREVEPCGAMERVELIVQYLRGLLGCSAKETDI